MYCHHRHNSGMSNVRPATENDHAAIRGWITCPTSKKTPSVTYRLIPMGNESSLLDAELGKHLASYVDSHLILGSTLVDAKAEMDAAAKAARQKAKGTQVPKTEPATPKKQEAATQTPSARDTTPSLFSGQAQSVDTSVPSTGVEGRMS
jgi:hypothetical protein